MALDVHFREDLQAGFLADLVLMITTTLVTGGDLGRLTSAVCVLQAQCIRYKISWPDVVQEAKKQISISGMASGVLGVAVDFLEDLTSE